MNPPHKITQLAKLEKRGLVAELRRRADAGDGFARWHLPQPRAEQAEELAPDTDSGSGPDAAHLASDSSFGALDS
jgi:hypothetical protein